MNKMGFADWAILEVFGHRRLAEWRQLWERHPDAYAAAEALDERTGHTFRSPGRDSQPAALKDLRLRFAEHPSLPMLEVEEDAVLSCRVCRL